MMTYPVLFTLHLLAAIIWVGGMFFAHLCLRPAALATLDPPQRLSLWRAVFSRFFLWVWVSIITLIVTGMGLVMGVGGTAAAPVHIHIMMTLGYVMAGVFVFIYFMPYRALSKAVDAQEWSRAGTALSRIRVLVTLNLVLGIVTVGVTYLMPVFA